MTPQDKEDLVKDFFISYGRRESLGLVARLHQLLILAGYDAWFDKVNIPDGDDYSQRIDQGIESAHNFVYVMAPRCLTSPYCLIELEYARLLGKRVIPINHMVIFNTPEQELSAGDQQVLAGFYKFYNLPDQKIHSTQDVLNRSLAVVGKTDWLAGQEKVSDSDCQRLFEWAQPHENKWVKHDDLDYLKRFELPVFGEPIDVLEEVVERITAVLERHKDYVHHHTEILTHALHWEKNQKATQHLLVGKERTAAEEWLLTEFLPPKQPPCQLTSLICEFICEARKNAENLMTDIFICYDTKDRAIRDSVIQSLSRYAKTTWTHDRDIQKGYDYECAIEMGIENADNFFYFISPHAITSEYCQRELAHALKYHKRIIPLLIAPTPETDIPEILRYLQYVDFTDNTCQADYDSDLDDILNILRRDADYYKQHKALLVRALKWEVANGKSSFLLRGHNLDHAKTWLRLNEKREQHPPLVLHKDLITASEAAKGQLGTEVFISYSRKNGDFARQLNTALQEAGKTTWFDQESISTGVNFEQEIFKGIDGADNFLFVISPDAVESEYCEREVNYASEQNKRFISVLHRETDPATLPESLRVINWIDFKDTAFDKSFPELIQAIELDRAHAHQHTLLQQRATEWDENSQCSDFLLNITACANTERWLKSAIKERKQPKPTALQRDFIQQSRFAIEANEKALKRRRQITFASVTVGIVITFLAIFAGVQMKIAQSAKQLVQFESQLTNASLNIRDENYLSAKEVLEKTNENELDQKVPAPRRHARNLLAWFSKLMGGESQQVYTGANAQLITIAISPDGRKLVAGGGGKGTLVVFDIETGELLQRLEGYENNTSVEEIVFHPEGKWLATIAVDKQIVFWSLSTGKKIDEWPLSEEGRALAVKSDGSYLASYDAKNITLWQLAEGKKPRILSQHKESMSSGELAFHPIEPWLASASDDNTAIVWDINTGEKLHTFKPIDKHADITFSPDGQYLVAGCYQKNICLWHIEKGELWKILQGHKNQVRDVRFVENGRYLISASLDHTLRLWDINSGVTLRVLRSHTGGVSGISTYAEKVFSASFDNTARRWDMALPYQRQIELSKEKALSVAITPKGNNIAIGFADGTLCLYSSPESKLLWCESAHDRVIIRLAFSPDGHWLASASSDKTAKLWKNKANQLDLQKTFPHSNRVYAVAFSPNSKTLATATKNGQIGLFSVITEQKRFIKQAHQGRINSVNFDASGTLLVSGGADGHTRLWEINKEPLTQLQSFPSATDEIMDTSISPDGQWIASVGRDQKIHIYAVNGAKQKQQILAGHEDSIVRVFFSPDSSQIVTVSLDATVRMWDFLHGNTLFTLHLPATPNRYLLWNFDFHCTSKNCLIAVPFFTFPKLMLYDLTKIYEIN